MSDTPEFRRGDVLLVALPFITDAVQAKHRPTVVIQNDIGNQFSPNLIVAYVTSRVPHRRYPTDYRIPVGSCEGRSAGLDRTAVVKTDTIFTVPKRDVVKRLGHLPRTAMDRVDECLRASLGLEEPQIRPDAGDPA